MKDFYLFMTKVKSGLIVEVKTSFIPEYLDKIDINFDGPIHVACENGHTEVVKFLIDKGANIELQKKFGWRPIFFACFNCQIDVIKLLIKNRCDINAHDQNNWQPIHWACRYGLLDIVILLIKNQCDFEGLGYDDLRPIHICCRYGYVDIVKLLIEMNCDIEVCDSSKWRPIHWACYNGNIEVVKLLIKRKCTLDMLSKMNKTPINIAEKYGHINVVKCIQSELKRQLYDRISKAFQIPNNFDRDQDIYSKCSTDFLKSENIGKGSYGKVYVYNLFQTDNKFAVKSTYIEKDDYRMIEYNINIYRGILTHERIIAYYGVVEKANKLYILMEYMPQGSLLNYIISNKNLPHKQIIKFTMQIIEGVAFLHRKKIIHRNITPSNILLDGNLNIKLTDFGLSRDFKKSVTHDKTPDLAKTFCEKINYLAPEIINGHGYHYPVDIWSVGATLVHMLSGVQLFHDKTSCEIKDFFSKCQKINFKPLESMSKVMSAFVREMLDHDPSRRPTADSLLKHKIFQDCENKING